eukprot:m.136661 g.136661  ORF g.136661 m.136661 type:complete len:556 (+) comp16031_c0_seq1:28-1695(+)
MAHEIVLGEIEGTAAHICSSVTKINQINDLFKYLKHEHATVAITASEALFACFKNYSITTTIIPDGLSPEQQAVYKFLSTKLKTYRQRLLTDLSHRDDAVAVHHLQTLVEMLVLQSSDTPTHGVLAEQVIDALLSPNSDKEDTLSHFADTFMACPDVQLLALRAIARCANTHTSAPPAAKRAKSSANATDTQTHVVNNLYMLLHQYELPTPDMLSELPTLSMMFSSVEDEFTEEPLDTADNDDIGDNESDDETLDLTVASAAAPPPPEDTTPVVDKAISELHKSLAKAFSTAWLEFLKLELPTEVFRDALSRLNDQVIPSLNNPKMLIDFLTDAYSLGGVAAVLSLKALFTLIYYHNLDYPDFYKQLYALLDTSIFYVKHRVTFFPLLDQFLSSTHLPAYLAAAFAKRLMRLALQAPPSGVEVTVQLVYNLIKRHGSLKRLAHRRLTDEGETPTIAGDPFDMMQEDPAQSNAMDSSFWELSCLLQHYHAPVQTTAELIKTPAFRKHPQPVAKMAQGSYNSAIQTTTKKPLDASVPLTFIPPTSLSDVSTTFELWQ